MAQHRNLSKKQRKKLAANNSKSTGIGRGSNYGYDLTGVYSQANRNVNYWSEAGYPEQLNFFKHWAMQARFGIAKAGILRLPEKCWKINPTITDGDNDGGRQPTKFEQDLKVLIDKHNLFERLKGADWRNRVGRYAGIIPIVKEQSQSSPSEPLSGLMGIESVLKLVPVFESQIDVTSVSTNSNLNDINYGMPMHYNYRENVAGDRNPVNNAQFELDPSRVFVFAEGADDGSIFGIPANEAGYNALMDLEIICASGQMGLHRNAKQRFINNIKDNQVAQNLKDPKLKAAYDANVDAFHKGGAPSLTVYGMDITSLQSTLADPTSPFTNSLNAYASSIGIPASEIIGVQMNRQASEGNSNAFNETAQSRCENVLTPALIKAFLNYLVSIGAMSAPSDEIKVVWPDFSEPGAGDKLDVSNKMMDANKKAREAGLAVIFSETEVREAGGYDAEMTEDVSFGEDDDADIKDK